MRKHQDPGSFDELHRLKICMLVACLLPVGIRAYRIHEAASYLESHGGNVWCDGQLYSGARESLAPLEASEVLLARTDIICRVLFGNETSVWVCYIPQDRDRFAESLACLNSQDVSFDVLGPKALSWLDKRFPDTVIRELHGPKESGGQTRAASPRKIESNSTVGTVEDSFKAAIAEIEEFETLKKSPLTSFVAIKIEIGQWCTLRSGSCHRLDRHTLRRRGQPQNECEHAVGDGSEAITSSVGPRRNGEEVR